MAYLKIMDDTTVTMNQTDVSMDGFYPQLPVGDITKPKSVSYPIAKKNLYPQPKKSPYPVPKKNF